MNMVLIVPNGLKAKANQIGEAMGWGPDSFSIALSHSGNAPATHWGLNLVEPSAAIVDGLANAPAMPAKLIAEGYPAQDFAAVIAVLLQGQGPFKDYAAANNLKVVQSDI